MTNQEWFNAAWDWFVVQGHGKSHDNGFCLYESPTGGRCAIGAGVPSQELRLAMNPLGSVEPILDDLKEPVNQSGILSSLKPLVEGADPAFLTELQEAHDNLDTGQFQEKIGTRLRVVAQDWGLQVPEEAAT